ncbi:hypothetical protein BC939DRAFT_445788 [Gamsiella multidivaricata]|uniref:uncharacterized protein n=1 Tax=Gamsiella multidivaricata TaxID=101098 RepID=UPI0022202DF6|nr:uncharacterized protein BC939DRAFT_445788 [Gamsiella multidivaricata]KAI7827108.1 hypothetical protein BC939DRAFT_445788 [Gamsiella multidivaricata]
MSSELCPANQLCALQSTSAVTGVCQVMEQFQKLCPSSPVINCVSSKDCTDPGFSYCAVDTNGNKICSGLGRPGTASQCDPNNPNNNNGSSGTGSSSVTTTLKYAGIAVGSIAFLAIIFALVRWRRNKSRSKMPDFAEIDYGMTNRRSEPRSSVGAAAAAAGAGEQSYPFSSRPHAKNQTVAAAQDDYYDEQYYADGYAQNAHPAAGMAGGAVKQGQAYYDGSYDNYNQQAYNSGYAQQGYDQQGYNQQGYDQQAYAQQGYDQHAYDQQYYNGYDQHGNYVGNGYYDANQAGGYEGYTKEEGYPVATSAAPVVPAEAVVRSGSRQRFGGAAPAAAAGDYAVDNYGAEPSELDFGGRGNGRKQ